MHEIKGAFHQSLFGMSNSFTITTPKNTFQKEISSKADNFSFSIQKNAQIPFQEELQKLEDTNHGRIIQSHRLIVTDSVKTRIELSLETPYSCYSSGEVSSSFVKSFANMEITSLLKTDGTVQLDLFIHYNSPKNPILKLHESETWQYGLQTQTTVEIGGVAVIGIPFPAHKNTGCNSTNQDHVIPENDLSKELLFFITPQFIDR